MPSEHSDVVGGSTAGIVLNCPGARKQIAKAPPEKSSEFAQAGTALHNAIELIVLNQTDDDAPERLWPTSYDGWKDPETGVTLDMDQCTGKLGPAWDMLQLHVLNRSPGPLLALETEVKGPFKPVKGAFGTIDIFAAFDDRVIIWDWKFGDGVMVDVEENSQLLFYACAAMFHPDLRQYFKPGMKVELWICQPAERNPETVDMWETTVEHLMEFAMRLTRAVKAGDADDAPLNPGDHCRWCKARVPCPKRKAVAEGAPSLDPNDLDPDDLGELLRIADLVEPWVSDVRKYAHNLMEGGGVATGFKLVNKRATRYWTDEDAAEKWLLSLDIGKADLYGDPAFLTPPAAEKLVGKKRFVKECGKLVKAVSSGTTLAPSSDKRAAVVNTNNLKKLGDQLKAQNSK